MKKIFVGNLAWRATEDDLRQLFEAYGTVVSVKIVIDQYTGKSKGFAFIEMESAEDAQSAINALNDKPFQERNLRVSLAQDRAEGGRGDRGGDRGDRGDRSDRGGYRSGNGGGRQNRGERSFNRNG